MLRLSSSSSCFQIAHSKSSRAYAIFISKRCKSSSSTLRSDYVVIGAGSAGCAVASRLARGGKSVTLLEAGYNDRAYHPSNLFVHMPTALAWPMSMSRYNWKFEVEPEPALNERIISCPRGKGLGGSSSINGMVYVRGHPQDFDNWGADGWSYRDVLPYFRRAENWQGADDPPYRGNCMSSLVIMLAIPNCTMHSSRPATRRGMERRMITMQRDRRGLDVWP